jgi:geranylgeranyl transferase type-2 subunit alpha
VKLKEELEIVITAAFTDPNDSSAWFYQRWLLGYSDLKLDLACFKLTKNFALIAFTKAVNLTKDEISITFNSSLDSGEWRAISGNKSDAIWIQRGDFEMTADKVLMAYKNNEYTLKTRRVNDEIIGIKLPSFGYEFGAAVIEELNNQLDSCNQLLEFEPDSKWTLLTAALLMRSIDRFQYHEKTLEFMRKLQKVDQLRAGYYKDLASKWILEVKLKEWIHGENFNKIDLSSLDLSTVYYSQYLSIAKEINLQENPKLNKNSCKFSLVDGCRIVF